MEDFLKRKLKYAREQLAIDNYFRVVETTRYLVSCKIDYFKWQGNLLRAKAHFKLRKIEQALDCFNIVLQFEPEHEEAKLFKIECLIDLKRFLEAREIASILANLYPLSSKYLALLSRIDYYLGDFNRVIDHCDQLIQMDKDNAQYYHDRAKSKAHLGYFKESLEDYRRAESLFRDAENLLWVYNNTGYAYSKLSKFSIAKLYLERALTISEEFPKSLNHLGWVLHSLSNTNEGLVKINRAIHLDPLNSYAHKNRAKIFLDLGQMKKAKVDLLKAKSLDYELLYGSEVNELIARYHFAV